MASPKFFFLTRTSYRLRISCFLILQLTLFTYLGFSKVGRHELIVLAFPMKGLSTGHSSARRTPLLVSGKTSMRRTSQQYAISIEFEEEIKLKVPGIGIFNEKTDAPTQTSHLTLNHEASNLQLSADTINGDQPIVLLDGLSKTSWTTRIPVSTESTPSSFSSVVLQTKVPSVPIESLPLGNFLASTDAITKSAQHPHKYLAAARLNRYWMGPKFGGVQMNDQNDSIPVDTQFLMVEIERNDSQSDPFYVLMMPLVDGGFRSTLESTSDSIFDNGEDNHSGDGHHMTLVSYSESGDTIPKQSKDKTRNAMYVAAHDEPYELLRIGFQQVSDVMGGTFKTLDQKNIPEGFVNSFGWCTWDAFYSKVHPSGILEGVQCLNDAGVPVKNVIVDDGWQQVSPLYPHQQQEEDDAKKPSLAASLSLSGSSDIMEEPDAMDNNSKPFIDSNESSKPSLLTSIKNTFLKPIETISSIGGSIFGVIASGVTDCYQKYVECAPVKSFPRRIWTFLARHSPLNYGLWKFFDSETDFGRQLDDPNPNSKFLDELEQIANTGRNKNMALKELVTTLKDELKVTRVYCWHSIHGYWRGVSDEFGEKIGIDVTQIKTRASDHLLRLEPEMAFDPPSLFGVGLIGKKGDLAKFYKHLHEPLVEAGVDGVKVDVQSGITAAGMRGKGFSDCPPLAKIYAQTMEESVSQRFSSTDSQAVECLNCMCHSTENLYRYKTTAVARASDDFYPARPESHSVHLVNVAYNSLFLGEICLPDWDMFHSLHKSAELHAAARAIGGCSVYVSDAPGKHNVPLLKKLVLPDGSVLRAHRPGRPTRDCIFADVGKDGTSALKIWNVNGSPKDGSSKQGHGGVVGVFNVQGVAWNFESNENEILHESPSPVTATIKPIDVDDLRQVDGPFAIWSHRTQSLQILPHGSSEIEVEVEHREWELFTVQPVQHAHGIEWAPIGLGDMLNTGGAIVDVGPIIETNVPQFGRNTTQWEKGWQADITTRGPGNFVSYCQPCPTLVLVHNGLTTKTIDFEHHRQSGLLEFDLPPELIEGKAHHVTVVWER